MLHKAEILRAREAGEIEIEPFQQGQLRGVSYVLRLGGRFRKWLPGAGAIRLWSSEAATSALAPPHEAERLLLEPSEFALGCTMERIRLSPAFAAEISPLSHVARFGLGITCGADLVNPGFGSSAPCPLTLELFNYNRRPIELDAGMPIAHLKFIRLVSEPNGPFPKSIYEGCDPLSASLLYEEWSTLIGENGRKD